MTINLVLVVVIVLAILLAWVAMRRERGIVKAAPRTARETDREDELVLQQLREHGADVSQPTAIRHYLYVPTHAEAELAVAELTARGFAAVLTPPLGALGDGTTSTDWGVVATETAAPSIEHVRATRAVFARLATKFGGTYDGWEAAVTP
jgi:hypothetical protein